MALEAPSYWYCDVCGRRIDDPALGLVINRSESTEIGVESWDYRIVHKNVRGETCDPGSRAGYNQDLNIEDYIGLGGQARLLSLLSPGPLIGPLEGPVRLRDIDNFVDTFRRLQTPNYEEARRRFNNYSVRDRFADANEVWPYMTDSLEHMASEPIEE